MTNDHYILRDINKYMNTMGPIISTRPRRPSPSYPVSWKSPLPVKKEIKQTRYVLLVCSAEEYLSFANMIPRGYINEKPPHSTCVLGTHFVNTGVQFESAIEFIMDMMKPNEHGYFDFVVLFFDPEIDIYLPVNGRYAQRRENQTISKFLTEQDLLDANGSPF